MQATKEAMTIVHDTYFSAAAKLTNVTSFYTGLAYNFITTQFIAATHNGSGCPQGSDEAATSWTEESVTWENAEDDAVIENFVKVANANPMAQLQAINATAKFIRLNDADGGLWWIPSYECGTLKGYQRQVRPGYSLY